MTDESQTDEGLDDEQADEHGRVSIKLDDLRKLRSKAKSSDTNADKVGELERKLAVVDAGLKLNPKQIKALWASHEGDVSPETLRATAVELGFVEDEQEEPEVVAAQASNDRITQAVQGATQSGKGLLTPTEVAAWPTDKLVRLARAYPEAMEMLKRGESVPMVGAF